MRKNAFVLVMLLLASTLLCACGGEQNETPTTTEEPTVDMMQKIDPTGDGVVNILMIGNSFCRYFTDELFAIARAAGIEMRICNVYAPGCEVNTHWAWWKNGESHYKLTTTDITGTRDIEDCDLKFCLEQGDWDVISLQDGSPCVRKTSGEEAFNNNKTYISDLISYIRKEFPKANLYWQQTWAYQVGYDDEGYKVADAEEQKGYAQRQYVYATSVCKEFNLYRINSGEAWQIVREKYGYDNLCARLDKNEGLGDYYHDGDIGGGQYLNACVWFEVLTGQSCIGNTFRPTYELSEEMIEMLQKAAHEAVENLNNAEA